jgi:hypothetical protein
MSAPLKIGVMPRVAATEIQVWWSPPGSTQWVAVGYNSNSTVSIATSPDGITWTDASNNPFPDGNANGIAFNGSYYVVVGAGSGPTGAAIATSTDGMTWTSRGNPFFAIYDMAGYGSANGIAWSSSQSQWVAVGSSADPDIRIVTSPDGISWTPSSNNPFSGGNCVGIAYSSSQDKWVAVGWNTGSSVCIATSTDGMSWTDSSNNPFSGGGYGRGIAYSSTQNKWVVVGYNNGDTVCIATSPDGMTWTDSVSGGGNNPFSGCLGIAWSSSQNKWVAVGNNSDQTVCIATSPDGMTWTDASNNPFSGGQVCGISWSASASQWVAVGTNNFSGSTVCIATSPDGMTWTESSNNPFSGGFGIGIESSSSSVTNYVLQKAVPYLCVDVASGQLLYSGDGVKWVASTIIQTTGILAYGNDMWLAEGDFTSGDGSVGQIYYSSDGFNWKSSLTFPATGGMNALLYRNGIWLAGTAAAGQSIPVIYYSVDGLIWAPANSPLLYYCESIDYGKDSSGNNLWVAIGGGGGTIAYSTNGIDWTMGTNNELIGSGISVTYGKDASGNSLWVASGLTSGNVILTYSYNGKIWYYNAAGTSDLNLDYPSSIAYANGVWVLACQAYVNALYYSHDGLRWTTSVSANSFFATTRSLVYGNDKWVLAGYNVSEPYIIHSADGVTWYPSSHPLTSYYIKLAYGDTNPIIIPAAESKGTYTVTGLTPLTDYTYMIQADCSGSYSDIAVYRTVKTSGRPQPVTALTKTQSIVDGQLRVTFAWSTPSDYAQYYVYGLRVKGKAQAIYEGQDITTIGNSYTFTVDPTREYTFSIQRGNDAGYSSLVSIDTVATTFDPTSVPGLWLWLDANDVGNGVPVPVDTEFSVWKDKSGKENDAVLGAGAAPATVDGAGKYVSIGSTWFNLTKSSWAYNQYFTFFVVEHRATSAETIYIANRNNGADKIKIGYTNSASIIFSTYADNVTLGSIDGINPPPINVLCFTNYGGKTAYWNKSVSGKNTGAYASFIVDSLLTIGTSTNVGRNEIYEVLMYRGIMKENDREAITNYLYDKWMPSSSSVIQGPVQNGMLMWLDAADKATLIKDASGTPVEDDGDAVYQWKDKSGLGNDMFDESAGSEYNLASGFPLFVAGANVSTNNIIQTNDATVFLLLYTVDTDYNTRTIFTHDVSGNYGLIITPTGKLSWRSGPTANNNQINFVAERFFLFYGTIKKGQLLSGTFIDQDGVQKVYDVDSFSYSLGSFPIVLTNLGTTAVRYGEVIYYNRALSDAELEVNAEYLANKWGLISLEAASAPGFSGLQLWLDSSDPYTVFKTGSTVTSWHDKSGLENNAIAYGAPTSENGITFHGSDYFSLPDGALPTGDYSYYIVSDFSSASPIVNGGSKDNGMWVAVGAGGSTIQISYDGVNWIASDNDPFSGGTIYGIAWSSSGSYWVAIGNNLDSTVCIATSTDGMTWTDASNNPFTGGRGYGIAYSSSQNKWVAVGYNSDYTVCIATSPDGMTWTDASNNPFSYARGIAYSPSQNKWVAVGASSDVCIATSPDGMTWTDASNNPFSGGGALGSGIAWGANEWVAVGYNSSRTVCIATSPDGMTWTDASSNPFSSGFGIGVAYSPSQAKWVAVGTNNFNTVSIATSPDGMTWTDSSNNPFSGGAGQGIGYSSLLSQWVAVGYSSTVSIATSPDGITWTDASNNPFSSGAGSAVAYAEGTYNSLRTNINVITDSSGTFAQTVYDYSSDRNMWINVDRRYSYDSVTWYDASGGNQLHDSIFYANGLWVAVGGYGFSYVYSTDGIDWIIPGYGDNGFSVDKANAIVYANGLWITGGVNSPDINAYMIPPIAYSSDGINWNTATVTQIDDCKTIAYGKDSSGNDLWVVGSRSLANDYYPLHYSANGMTWLTVSGSDTLFDVCKTVIYGKGIWLAGGEGANTMMYSITGYTWIPDISGSAVLGGACNSIALGEDLSGVELFVAAGGISGEILAYSYDGLAWQTCIYDSESINTFGNVSYSNGLWLCPCDPVIATSRDGITWISSGVQNLGFTVIAGGRGSVTVNKSTLTDTNEIPYGLQMGFVAVGTNSDNTVSIATSTDGLTWKPSFNNPFSGGAAQGIAWNGSYWVAVGSSVIGGPSIATSPDGMTWTDASNNPFSNGIARGIAYSPSQNKWVVVGNGPGGICIATSTDGMTWLNASNNPFSGGEGYGIAYSSLQNKWVAVGRNSGAIVCIATSPDGMTWTDASNNPFSGGYGNGIAYSPSQNNWVAVGNGSVNIATSPDGMTWTDSSNNPFSGGLGYGIAWSGSLWVAVGRNSDQTVCIASSPDGMTWTNASNNPFSGGNGLGVAYSANKWVAVGTNYPGTTVSIATSPDGVTWTPASNNSFSGGQGYAIAAGIIQSSQSKTVIVESIKGASRSMFLSGLTGATDSATHIQDSTQNYIGWDLSGYMHGTIKEMLVYNTAHDAEKRLQVERYLKNKWFPTAFKPTDVSGASLWLDASEENFIYGSKNRIQTWKDKTGNCIVKQDVPWAQPIYSLDSVTGLRGVQFGADAIANGLVDISGSPFGSGNSWSVFTVHRYDYSTDLDEAVNGCVCTVYEASFASASAPTAFKAGSTFVTLENGVVPSELKLTEGSSVAISADVRRRPVMTGQLVNSLTSTHTVNGADYPIGGLLVAGGFNSDNSVCIASSRDGITWIPSSNNPFSGGGCLGIAYNGIYWVAVGYNLDFTVCIATSPDGITWTESENPFSVGAINGIAWSGSYWLAVGSNSDGALCIASSPDGMTWTDSVSAGGNSPFSGAMGIAYNGSQWVAVGLKLSTFVCIASSTDGITWTDSSNNPFFGGQGRGIAWSASQSQWVAVGFSGDDAVSIATSPDGMTWTASENPFFAGGARGIAYSSSQDKWVVVGASSGGTVSIATSSDGVIWADSSNNPFFEGVGIGISYSASVNQWVALGYNGDQTVCIATSPDGMTWADASNNPFTLGQAFAVAESPPPNIQPMANARMNIGFTAPLTPALGGAMRGYIYEILCYKGAVSPSDQQKIEGYLAWKWCMQDSLPQTHPYYLGPP